jgi:hypothetical protein
VKNVLEGEPTPHPAARHHAFVGGFRWQPQNSQENTSSSA